MAASMIWKGIHRAQVLCITQNDFGLLLRCQKPMCRYRTNAATDSKTTIPEFLKPKKEKRSTPIHSIYIMNDYPPLKFKFEECIQMHKEAAQPAMTNTLHTQIYADLKLDFTTNKKTRFMKNIWGLLEFPNPFEHQQKKNIFVFSESQEDQALCKELGATQVGGDDLIALFNQGILRKDDVAQCDFVFSSPAMAVKLLKLRSTFMDKIPTLKNGCITNDFEATLKQHMAGVSYKSHKDKDAVGVAQVPFGQLKQDTDALRENFTYMLSTLMQLKPKSHAPLVESIKMIAPPSSEMFEMDLENFGLHEEENETVEGNKELDEEDEE